MSGPTFYLTQRLTRRDRAGAKGFDGKFECQYMGSAEFEWGALPESLARMRKSTSRLVVHVGRVTRGEATMPVFVVGDRGQVAAVPDALSAWMADDYPRGKEMTYFPEHVDGSVKDYQVRTHAWWSLTDDVMWALDADTADQLLQGGAWCLTFSGPSTQPTSPSPPPTSPPAPAAGSARSATLAARRSCRRRLTSMRRTWR